MALQQMTFLPPSPKPKDPNYKNPLYKVPQCKGRCSNMGIIVTKGKGYTPGKKYCPRCQQFIMWKKKCCPCCGCCVRNGPDRRNARRNMLRRQQKQNGLFHDKKQ